MNEEEDHGVVLMGLHRMVVRIKLGTAKAGRAIPATPASYNPAKK